MGLKSTIDVNGNHILAGGLKVQTTGGTPTYLNFFQDEYQHISNLTGAISVSNYTITIFKINKIAIINFPLITTGSALSGTTINFSTALSSIFRPIQTTYHVAEGVRNTAGSVLVSITNAGIITIYGDTNQNGFLNARPATLYTTNMILYTS